MLGLVGEEKMWPFYFRRESMFSESDSEIPGTVSAATRPISFKVIPDFQSENCNFYSVTYIWRWLNLLKFHSDSNIELRS